MVAEEFCSTLDPMSIIVMVSYECDVNSEIVSPSEHYIKVIKFISPCKIIVSFNVELFLDDSLA